MRILTHIILSLIFFLSFSAISQPKPTSEFGNPTQSDFDLHVYEKDSTAAAVVIYERGYYYYDDVGGKVKLIKYVYRKIKVFDSKRFAAGTVIIPLLVQDGMAEKFSRYNAWTYNGTKKSKIMSDAIFITSAPGIGRVGKIVLPNIHDGTIIEYVYKIESPFLFNFDGWDFQGELPKMYSEFIFKIPLALQFNNVLYGDQPLYLNIAELTDDCLQTEYNTNIVKCPIYLYAMKDVPAFQEEEYMLSPKNYIARVDFEPQELRTSSGWTKVKRISTEWKDVDKFLKKGDIGKQLDQGKYFKKNLPDAILLKENELDRAQAIYTFIQNHYTWDGSYYSSEIAIKDDYNEKKGSVASINLSLINALNAAGLDAKLMLLSTRQNGLPTALYPVMTKFNYIIAMLKIGDDSYLLDATDKIAPFGIIPFPTLNVQGRVIDFKNGSYWMPIEPFDQNMHYVNSKIKVDKEGKFIGKVSQTSTGYLALEKRTNIEEIGVEDYLKNAENTRMGIEISDYQLEDLELIDKPLRESFDVIIEPEIINERIIFNPFFNEPYISENPFKMKERSYPMDFGFPFTNTYLVSIDLNEMYEIEELPKNRSIKLPGDDGECSITYVSENNTIGIRFNMKLSEYRFQPDAYQSLKDFFGTMITILKNESIILKRKQ